MKIKWIRMSINKEIKKTRIIMKIVKGIDKIEVKYIEKQKTERQLKHLLFPLYLIVFHLPFVPIN